MFTGVFDLPWWGYVVYALVGHPHHDRRRHHLPAPLPGAPRARSASGRQPFLPLLAVAHHRHGHQELDRDPPQAPRAGAKPWKIRTARRSTASTRCCGKAPNSTARKRATRKPSDKYGHGTPDDWIERNLYTRHDRIGISILFVINFALFGFIGITIWAVQMAWIPFFAAGVINGIGHYWGYRTLPAGGREHQHRAVGHPDRRRGTAQQPPRLRRARRASPTAGTNSTSAGSTSA